MPDPQALLDEGIRAQQLGVFDRALECFNRLVSSTNDPAMASEAWRRVSSIHRARCRWGEATEAARCSRVLAERAGAPDQIAEAVNAEAAVFMYRGDFETARGLLAEAVDLARSDRTLGIALQNLGFVAARTGDLDAAERYLHAAGGHFKRAGYRWGEACVLTSSTGVALDRGDNMLADQLGRQAADAAREVDDMNLFALAISNRAEALAGLDKYSAAEALATEALGYFIESGDVLRQVEIYKLLGDIGVKCGEADTARSCYLKGVEIASSVGARPDASALDRRLQRLQGADSDPGSTGIEPGLPMM